MTHTHKDITHPALRVRMAEALNWLRLETIYQYWYHQGDFYPDGKESYMAARKGIRAAASEMARLEQALDTAQAAAVDWPRLHVHDHQGELYQRLVDCLAQHPVGEWWPSGYPNSADNETRTEPQGSDGQ